MANRRFEMHEYRNVLVRMRLGDSDRTIASAGLMGRRKAAQLRALALEQGWLELTQPLPDDAALAAVIRGEHTPRSTTTSSVAPFADQVRKWHAQGIQGTTIHQALVRNHGFTGSYSAVRRFLRTLAPPSARATTILDFEAGDLAQVDFGSGPEIVDAQTGEPRKSWVFVMTLAWSRHQYAELVRDQTVDTWLRCHRNAFAFFGGVPARVMVDNAKCAIVRACFHDPCVQRSYAELAEGYGFRITACPPRTPQHKGRVEAGVKFVKRSFMPLRTFRSLQDANHQLRAWVLAEAGNRTHGVTRERPLTRFQEIERALLQRLPDVPPEPARWARVTVHRDGHVQFEHARYSVPFQRIGQTLWLKATITMVQLHADHELVTTHPRRPPGGRSTIDDHLPPEALAYKRQDPEHCLEAARAVGPHCAALVEARLTDRILDNLRAVQKLLALRRSYGDRRLEAACGRALAHDDTRYRTVKTILERGLDACSAAEPADPDLSASYTGTGRFTRNSRELLAV